MASPQIAAAFFFWIWRASRERAVLWPDAGLRLELTDVVWGRPLVASRQRQINVALFKRSDEQVDFEIYSIAGDNETVHCQGQGLLHREQARGTLDLQRLQPGAPGQILTPLRLPATRAGCDDDYVLHPAVMHDALHTASALLRQAACQPRSLPLPTALDSLQIQARCSGDTLVWVRQAAPVRTDDRNVKLDLDLCDTAGRLFVAMRGLTYLAEGAQAYGRVPTR